MQPQKGLKAFLEQINMFRDILAMAGTLSVLNDGNCYTRFLEVPSKFKIF